MRMNKRKFAVITFFLLVTIVLIGGWYFFSQSTVKPEVITSISTVEKDEVSAVKGATKVGETEQQPSLTPEELLEHDPGLAKARALQDASHSRIEFYGQVIDQLGEPVEGAVVNYSYTYYPKGILPAASWSNARGNVKTDEQGRFEIKGHEGVFLSLKSIAKSGYQFRPPQGLGYIVFTPRDTGEKRHIPDPNNPVLIPAWKKTEVARELKRGEERFTVFANGESYTVKLPDFDQSVRVAFQYTNESDDDVNRRCCWRATLSVNDGGLIESDDPFMYEAPESGYQSSWETSAPEHQNVQKRFYLKGRNGQVFGRIEIYLRGYYGQQDKGYVDYKYWINPTGSRNLLSEKD